MKPITGKQHAHALLLRDGLRARLSALTEPCAGPALLILTLLACHLPNWQ